MSNGYFPALASGEEEVVSEVHSFEKRQAVAVTLGTVYDECVWHKYQTAG